MPGRKAAQRTKLRRTAVVMGAVAALGTAGLAAGGGLDQAERAPIAQPVDEPAAQGPVDSTAWANQARIALASVDTQLTEISDAEAALAALPDHQRAKLGDQPARDLSRRKQRLTEQRAMISTALEAESRLPGMRAGLDAAQRQLTSVETLLAAPEQDSTQGSGQSRAAAPDTTVRSRLVEQRDSLKREEESMRRTVAGWQRTLEAAVNVPLPDERDVAETKRIAESTIALTRPTRPRDRDTSRGRDSVPAVADRDRERPAQRVRDDATTAGPPRRKQPQLPQPGKTERDGGASRVVPAGNTTASANSARKTEKASSKPDAPVTRRPAAAPKQAAPKSAAQSSVVTFTHPRTGDTLSINLGEVADKARRFTEQEAKARTANQGSTAGSHGNDSHGDKNSSSSQNSDRSSHDQHSSSGSNSGSGHDKSHETKHHDKNHDKNHDSGHDKNSGHKNGQGHQGDQHNGSQDNGCDSGNC